MANNLIYKGRDSKDMLKVLNKKFFDNIDKVEQEPEDDLEYENRKSEILSKLGDFTLAKRPSHLNDLIKPNKESWYKNRESLSKAILEDKPEPPPQDPKTIRSMKKENRLAEENYAYTLKWDFVKPTKEHIEELKIQMLEAGFYESDIKNFFSDNFKHHIVQMNLIRTINRAYLRDNIDLILKWLTIRFYDANPIILYKSIEFMDYIFKILVNDLHYQFCQSESDSFLPYFMLKLGDPRYLVRKGFRHILKHLLRLTDFVKIYQLLIKGLDEDRSDECKVECLEEIGYIFDQFGIRKFSTPSFKKIFRMISHQNPDVRNAALNTLAFNYLKYEKEACELFADLTEQEEIVLDKHICQFESQAKIFPLKRSLFLVDSYAIMEAIRSMTGFLKYELKQLDFDINEIDELLIDILDKNKDLSITSLLEIKGSMKDKFRKKYVLENIDQIIYVCSIKFMDSIEEYFKNNRKKDEHLIELIQIIIKVLNDLFESGIGKSALTDSVKYIIYALIRPAYDSDFDQKDLKKDIKKLLDRILRESNQTTCFCALIRLLKESFIKNYANKKMFVEIIAGIIWEKLSSFNWNLLRYNDLNVDDLTKHIDVLEVLFEIHLFLETMPVDTWKSQTNDLALRAINTIIYEIVKIKRSYILDDIEVINVPHDAEIKDFVISVLDWVEHEIDQKAQQNAKKSKDQA